MYVCQSRMREKFPEQAGIEMSIDLLSEWFTEHFNDSLKANFTGIAPMSAEGTAANINRNRIRVLVRSACSLYQRPVQFVACPPSLRQARSSAARASYPG